MFAGRSRLARGARRMPMRAGSLRQLAPAPRALSTLSSPSPANNALSPTIFETAADNFLSAWSDDDGHGCGLRMPPLRPSVLPALECLDDVFRVHDAMIQSPQSDRLGGHAGWKLGWKGNPLVNADPSRLPAMYSPIFAGCLFPSGTTLSLSHHKECYTQEEVWAAVRSYEPCIELCGARFTTATTKASPYHLLADAMNNAAVIRGIPLVPPPATPPAAALTGGSCLVRLLVDGKEASSGTGEENPADSPLGALTFLANDLSRRGKTLEAGHFVIAGHTCQVAFSSRPAPPSARTLSQAPVCGARVVPDAAVEFGAHSVLEAYHEGCGTVRAILVD